MLRKIIAFVIVLSTLASAVFAYAATPRLNALINTDLSLDISPEGITECSIDAITMDRNLTVYVSMMLYQDDGDYAAWEYSESGSVSATESVSVSTGHEYYAGVYILVTDADGNMIDRVISYTDSVVY